MDIEFNEERLSTLEYYTHLEFSISPQIFQEYVNSAHIHEDDLVGSEVPSKKNYIHHTNVLRTFGQYHHQEWESRTSQT